MLQLAVKNNKLGIPTYLSPDEEAFVVAAAEIEGCHGFSIKTDSMENELQIVVE